MTGERRDRPDRHTPAPAEQRSPEEAVSSPRPRSTPTTPAAPGGGAPGNRPAHRRAGDPGWSRPAGRTPFRAGRGAGHRHREHP
ncbi:hypothetical protein GCM10010286_05360 [Streptomyces toxytricini]|nr:hypothetical protein GCM10010286_05360 [Streptomyces toxytricini]